MKPSSRGPSSCQDASSASNKTALGTSCVPVAFTEKNDSRLPINRSLSQTSCSSTDANDNAARSRVGARDRQPRRRQYKSRCRAAVRTQGLVRRRRVASCHFVRNKSRREVVRRKQRGRLGTARLRLPKEFSAVTRTRRNKSRTETIQPELNSRIVTFPVSVIARRQRRRKNESSQKTVQLPLSNITARSPVTATARRHRRGEKEDNARNSHSFPNRSRRSVSRYKLVSRLPRGEELCPMSSCSGTSRRCRPKRNSSNNSLRRGRDHRRHKNRSGNRRAEESSSSSGSGAQCCQYRERSPLQSPVKSSLCSWQDSALQFISPSKRSRCHHTKSCSSTRSNESQSLSSSDIETDNINTNEKRRDRKRKSKKRGKRANFFACVVM